MKKERIIVITGPTGVGKSDLALLLAEKINGEIINCDVGQFYKPLTIGTAKPDWQSSPVAHHLFDVITDPVNFTAVAFRELVGKLISEIESRGHVPMIVGGSGFYINSLFFPPQRRVDVEPREYSEKTDKLWLKLHKIDPQRASEIQKNDRYRIERALDIWYGLNIIPSKFKPKFDPIAPALLFVITRKVKELYNNINERVKIMIDAGWISEVEDLSPAWHKFLLKKKLIGYDDVIRYLHGEIASRDELVALIQKKTRNYAKRQLTFNRMLTKKFEVHLDAVYTEWVNMTGTDKACIVDAILSKLKEKGYV